MDISLIKNLFLSSINKSWIAAYNLSSSVSYSIYSG